MVRRNLIIAIIICSVVLTGCVAFAVYLTLLPEPEPPVLQTESTEVPTEAPTQPPTARPTEPEPTTQPTETQPQAERFTLSFVGDCTLGTLPDRLTKPTAFPGVIGDDYSKPFQYVYDYLAGDDCTFANFEGVLVDGEATAEEKTFVFRGPTGYGNILTAGSVELVSLANNHTFDFGYPGYVSTQKALENAGVSYVVRDGTALYTTESGLTVGVYAVYWTLDKADMRADVEKLRQDGAEIVVAAVHMGNEGSYAVTDNQISVAHALIDSGVDIVWGHHPHVLQRIEEYGGGIIFYSLGNFVFGGNHNPYDYDTAIIQQEILRDEDGTVRLGGHWAVPCSVSSVKNRNDFQPVTYASESKEFERVLSKLAGTFEGADVDLSYRDEFTKPTEPAPTEPPQTTPPTQPPETTLPTEPTEETTQPTEQTEPTVESGETAPTGETDPTQEPTEATEPLSE